MRETSSQPLESLIEHYEQALTTLEAAENEAPQKLCPLEKVLAVLVARDAVQTALADARSISTEGIVKLDKLDNCLRKRTDLILALVTSTQWRTLLCPSEQAWWWFPRLSLQPWWTRVDWLWNTLTFIAFTGSFSLLLNTATRLWTNGPEPFGTFAIVIQSLLTLLASGKLTNVGQKACEEFAKNFKIPQWHWPWFSTATTWVFLALVASLHATLPYFASAFDHWGVENYRAGQLGSALSNYQRAIAIQADYAKAHYHLGVLYEDLQKFDQAKEEYQFVVKSDPDVPDSLTWLKAHNNLARLYILEESAGAAIPLLIKALQSVDANAENVDPELKDIQYNLLKNLGWARLEQQRYPEAEAKLQAAIALDSDRAPAHCLLAQVLDAQAQQNAAHQHWEACLQYANSGNPDEDHWIGLAQKALTQEE